MVELGRDTAARYDQYWRAQDVPRRRARSEERAALAVELLRARGVPPGRLLDVGCGPGWALEVFARAGYTAIGIDASSVAVQNARGRGLDVREVDFAKAPVEALHSSLGKGFPVVVALEVLEHVEDPLDVLRRLGGLLASGGQLVVSLPNEIHVTARLRILVGRLPFGGHRDPHVRHFDLRRAHHLLEVAGCRLVARRWLSVIPPRRPLLQKALQPLVALFPGMLALSAVYLLEGPFRDTR